MSLGQHIRELREKRDLSLRELAKKLDCSAPFLSDIELGRRFPSEGMLSEIASKLGVKSDSLKVYDTRPPVEEMKERIAFDPKYALAFRTVINKKISADALIDFANKKKSKETI